jgi:hypothetical protein
MKTIKILLGIAGFALSTFCFGQLHSESRRDLVFYNSYYNLASNRMEHYVDRKPTRISSGDYFEAPVESKTFYVPIAFDMAVEEWMTTPFESTFYEADIQLESWMLSPFENSYYEEDLVVEPWMTRPFESEESFIELLEEEIEVEEWMTRPFSN